MKRHSVLLLIVYLMLGTQYSYTSADTFYVTPSTSTPCGSLQPCFTLSEYAAHPNEHFANSSNIELLVLPGNHSLSLNFTIQDRMDVQISIQANDSSSETEVTCGEQISFIFQNVTNVTISDIQFNGCGGNRFDSVTQLLVQRSILNGQGRHGSGLYLQSVNDATIVDCTFTSNAGGQVMDPFESFSTPGGGAMVVLDSANVLILTSTFDGNTAAEGGAIFSLRSEILINQSSFFNNVADVLGGGIYDGYTTLYIYNSTFTNNSAYSQRGFGGAIESLLNSTTVISGSIFVGNTATFGGGAIDSFDTFSTNISESQFYQNKGEIGSALYVELDNCFCTSVVMTNNTANTSVFHIIKSEVTVIGYTTITDNIGSVFSFASNITFSGYTLFMNNIHPSSSQLIQEGGAMTIFQGEIFFKGSTVIINNTARIGGGISAQESNIYMYGSVNISHNVANISGGGFFLYRSQLTFNGTAHISNNLALTNGGGFYSVSSTINVNDGSVRVANNFAKNGGAMYLELNAKLYIVKFRSECTGHVLCNNMDNDTWIRLEIVDNTADYGGGLYIADDTNSGACSAIPFRTQFIAAECFFQTLDLHSVSLPNLNIRNTYYINNTATITGDNIYGGLLDRCEVSSFSEIFRVTQYTNLTPLNVDAISYLLNVTNIQRGDLHLQVKSDPVRICICKNNTPDCSVQPPTISIRRGESTKISLAAVDQANNTVPNSFVGAYLSDRLGLDDGQSIQSTENSTECSDLQYNIHSSQQKTDVLSLYASDGPCNDIGISRTDFNILLLPCPPGFMDTGTECTCDDTLSPEFITNCSANTGLVTRVGSVWVSVVNATAEDIQYITYPNCPFDYCQPSDEKIHIDLSVEGSSDAQCSFNRTGILCGTCSDNLSQAFGSSRCLPCSNNWLALLIVFIIAGIALVGFLLLFNLTVAVGTIDALIFYANIVGANRATMLPFKRANVLSIFIAWLNLDFGFETCFYDGLNEYAKVWLQFVFPLYIIFLVAMVMVFSKYSTYFAKLLSKRNPIAVLATLILLSFTKLVRTVIAGLSFTTLTIRTDHSDFTKLAWLIDSNVPYLERKHMPLFIVAILVFLIILSYIMLLFFWQWLLRCPSRKLTRWIRDVRLNSFMDAYNAPFTERHRYWTGLLLIARGILYLVSALNVFQDSKTPLYAIVVMIGSLFGLKEVLNSRIYKKRFLNVLEGAFLYNLLIFAATSLYFLEENSNSLIYLAYISTSIAFALFVVILIYHIYTYFLKNLSFIRKMNSLRRSRTLTKSTRGTQKKETDGTNEISTPLTSGEEGHVQSGDFSRLRGELDVLDSLSTSNYERYIPPNPRPKKQRPTVVTYSVVGPLSPENSTEESLTHV